MKTNWENEDFICNRIFFVSNMSVCVQCSGLSHCLTHSNVNRNEWAREMRYKKSENCKWKKIRQHPPQFSISFLEFFLSFYFVVTKLTNVFLICFFFSCFSGFIFYFLFVFETIDCWISLCCLIYFQFSVLSQFFLIFSFNF